jgi:hypothetical protein
MRLGDFEFDPTTGELQNGGRRVRLEPQPAALLALLASRPGQLVSHDDIRGALWGTERHVSFNEGVQYCVRQIRIALNDSARHPTHIETIPRRGYRLIAQGGLPPHRKLAHRRVGWAALAVAVAALSLVAEQRPNRHHDMAKAVLTAVHNVVF